MYRLWTVTRSAVALPRAAGSWLLRVGRARRAWLAMLVAISCIPPMRAAAQEAAATADSARPGTLKLGIQYNDPATGSRLQEKAATALALAGHFQDFECRLSSEVLNCARGARIVLEGPFQDVLVKIPVSGDARLEGSFRVSTVPDTRRATLDVHITGTIEMRGTGQTQGVRIDSDATARFQAVKRLYVTNEGATSLPATCKAESSLTFTGIHSRPRLLGKFAERIAQQRAHEEKEQAEAECTQHVTGAIQAVLDREVDRLALALNRAIQNHLTTASETQRANWRQTSFRTDADAVSIARTGSGGAPLAPWQPDAAKSPPAIVLRLPRTAFRADQLLLALGLMSGRSGNSLPPTPAAAEEPWGLRPSVTWQEQTVTVAVHVESATRLAREPVAGAAQ